MTTSLEWQEILLRLGLAFGAGLLLGWNRNETGHVAGLRTLLLVCLAAAVSMIQVNLLLGIAGKRPDSFAVLDLMRLPLGILSGMGFIGAGAILRRGNLVIGVTTAATLWFATVIGLCFGGGQLGLGGIALALSLVVLWGLKVIEEEFPQRRTGRLFVATASPSFEEAAIRTELTGRGVRLLACSVSVERTEKRQEYDCLVRWRGRPSDSTIPEFVHRLRENPLVEKIRWSPEALSDYA